MKTKLLEKLFIVLALLILIFLAALLVVGEIMGEAPQSTGFEKITASGQMETFEISHEEKIQRPVRITTDPSDRYRDEFWTYMQDLEKARDQTFFR